MLVKTQEEQLAVTILEGFDKHYRIFREITSDVKVFFETEDWQNVQQSSEKRISLYEQRVKETIEVICRGYNVDDCDPVFWRQVKLIYTRLLQGHLQPELAETFYNSVFCHVFHRRYYNNELIFISTSVDHHHLAHSKEILRSYQLDDVDLFKALKKCLDDFDFTIHFRNIDADLKRTVAAIRRRSPFPLNKGSDIRIDMVSSPFFRNKGAYLVGRLVCPNGQFPFMVSLHNEQGIYIDALITEVSMIKTLFGFARAYFLVETEVPGVLVNFLSSLWPSSRRDELYSIIGLHKQGKSEFYRDFLMHLEISDDPFVIAPGIKGMVMLVFTLHSYPYVFKVIKDKFAPSKKMSREDVKSKYRLVKMHDRAGRMADTLEYSHVAFPRHRFSDELIQELQEFAPSMISVEDEYIVIRHLYIERRMRPLNMYLAKANEEDTRIAIREYGAAVKQLIKANIFPGDMLLKNFGVTRHKRVVLYDYDEIEYITDCRFRRIPPSRHFDDDMFDTPAYSIEQNDIFPEEIATVALTKPKHRQIFREEHADLLDASYWRDQQDRLSSKRMAYIRAYPRRNQIRRTYIKSADNRR